MEELEFVFYDENLPNQRAAFLEMFSDYFDELFQESPEDNIPKKYLPGILCTLYGETKKYSLWVCLCFTDNKPIGFMMAQIDTKQNPLCKREGWGFIREFYIVPDLRRRGYGSKLCSFTETLLYSNGAKDIYLTADSKFGEPFWESMGYSYSGKVDDKNGDKIYEKCSSK